MVFIRVALGYKTYVNSRKNLNFNLQLWALTHCTLCSLLSFSLSLTLSLFLSLSFSLFLVAQSRENF